MRKQIPKKVKRLAQISRLNRGRTETQARFPDSLFKFHCTVGCSLVAISLTQKYDIY